MNWFSAIVGVFVLWSGPSWAATLTWNANSEPDLAGYRIYQCSQLPCSRASGNASSLTTLGAVTTFNIGTPTVTQHYFVTAYDFANNESTESNLATFTPTGSPPPVVPPVIGASPTSLSFTATQGGANPPTQAVNISNVGGGTLGWSANDNVPWFSVSPASGTGNGSIIVSVNIGGLIAGNHNGAVTLNGTGATPVTVPVTLTVAIAPVPPSIGVSPTSLSFTATQGSANPAPQSLSISNTGGGTLSWTTDKNVPWLTLTPTSGTANGHVIVNVVTGVAPAGTYNGAITLNAAGASPVTVPVLFTVTASPPPPPPPPPTAPPTPRGLRITPIQ
jgi:hypothetical protein